MWFWMVTFERKVVWSKLEQWFWMQSSVGASLSSDSESKMAVKQTLAVLWAVCSPRRSVWRPRGSKSARCPDSQAVQMRCHMIWRHLEASKTLQMRWRDWNKKTFSSHFVAACLQRELCINFRIFCAPVFIELVYFLKSHWRWKHEGEAFKSC